MRNNVVFDPAPGTTATTMQQVITANRLRDGVVVFVGPGLQWVERLPEAEVYTALDTAAAALQAAQKDEAANLVLDIYAIDVADRQGELKPIKLREAIRAQGPTVHPEHGKMTGRTAKNGSDSDVSI